MSLWNDRLDYIRSIPKTMYVNFKYFPFKDALKVPLLVSHRVYLKSLKGELIIEKKISFGIVKIGFGDISIFDKKNSRTIWEHNKESKIIFKGKANIGHGSKVSVSNKGHLIIGENFVITAESAIVCQKKISFGHNCLISWDTLIMDSDFHKIKNNEGNIINKPKEIVIGDNVWIGCRNLILKGSRISDNTIVGASSLTNKAYQKNNIIIGGNPSKIIAEKISWEV